MIKIESLSKTFGGQKIIDYLSLSFPKEGLVIIKGPSGIGKSTLLKIIAGLLPFEEGVISYTEDEKISFAFQSPSLFPSLTALKNVAIASKKKEAKKKAAILLNELGIDEIDKYPSELSGGMAMRVNIARALLREADVYLFDEPFASLDEESAEKTLKTILKETENKLVIMVIHADEIVKSHANLYINVTKSPISNETLEIISK